MKTKEPYNEQECLLRAAAGDERAFGEIFNQYHHLLSNHIFRLTESREMADDMVQEVFIKIWAVRESLAEIKYFRTWLHTVSKNQTLDALRKIAKQRVKHQQFEYVFINNNETEEDPELINIIDQAVAALPPQQKKVYLLSRHENLSYKEIAVKMSISQETVKSYMKLALASVTKMVKDKVGLTLLLAIFYRI